ncbi:UNKNOWN [Stylonychia lemnae]|uniref:Uncharacterized protein n=1 Tax=Stylonychia lemnae TaxID=5949 RepID=A0A078ARM9_STYLE|nr:UNKNOWN [Stylonychia lemnae]|eukprot:CDW84859.1 UNKNOWN [Stylonychia lemnae]
MKSQDQSQTNSSVIGSKPNKQLLSANYQNQHNQNEHNSNNLDLLKINENIDQELQQGNKHGLVNLALGSCEVRDGSLRSDVLYKTIIRDMRKYYSLDLNGSTNFIKKKRHKDDKYFYECIFEYINQKFPYFQADLQNLQQNRDPPALTFKQHQQRAKKVPDFNDIICFIGCLLYPKDIKNAIDCFDGKNNERISRLTQFKDHNVDYKTLHSYLYNFSLEKLNNLIKMKYFAFFYCHYYLDGIIKNQRIEKKVNMNKYRDSYHEASYLIFKLCQGTLVKMIESIKNNAKYIDLYNNIKELLAKDKSGKNLSVNQTKNNQIDEPDPQFLIPKKLRRGQSIYTLEKNIRAGDGSLA